MRKEEINNSEEGPSRKTDVQISLGKVRMPQEHATQGKEPARRCGLTTVHNTGPLGSRESCWRFENWPDRTRKNGSLGGGEIYRKTQAEYRRNAKDVIGLELI